MDTGLSSYLPAIELIMCHLGKSFDEACDELGLNQRERQRLAALQAKAQDQNQP
jgi:hypothetical protein